jgi:hypothetical protein
MQGLGYLGRFRPFPLVIPGLEAGISRPRGGEDILGPPLAGSWLRSGGCLVVEDTVEVRLRARRYELTDWLGSGRVVVADQRLPIYKGRKLVEYRAEVVEVREYYSCGLDIFQHFHFLHENNWVMRLLGGNLEYGSHSYIIKASECDLGVYSHLNMQWYPKFEEYLSKVDPMDKAPSPRHLDKALKEKGLIKNKNDEDGKR